MSKSRIADYMAELAKDPAARKAFNDDPDKAMRDFGLTAEERAVVATRDPAKIREAVRKKDPKAVETLAIVLTR